MTANPKASMWLVALACAAAFVFSAERLKAVPRQTVTLELQVALPLFVQVFMTAGDRYLAADLAAIRALVVATDKMRPEDYRILGKIQEDASWLNPAHEDNYYTAAAILPWSGELDAAQTILARATKARYFDYQPAFYYAFNLLHFKGDAAGASAWMRAAAEKLPSDEERLIMQNLAARWMDRAEDTDLAIRIVEAMAQQAKRKDFRAYLEQRVVRLRSLKQLRAAAERFREQSGRPLVKLRDLVDAGLVTAIPADPFGFGFDVDKQGQVVLRTSPPSLPRK
ncbi:MAG: hypothetical protein Q7J42_00345 [Sulfuritalea sp.]|nr:hypothetical protein [Sulfuritalea sp.]